jgi:hypothetical protein
VKFITIEPEVAGGWGSGTVADTSIHPPLVTRLHYEFQGWLGDDLLESFPCFIVTDRLACALGQAQLSGFTFDRVEVSTSQEFDVRYPSRRLPKFHWLRVTGRPGVDDLGIGSDHRLVASAEAIKVLARFNVQHADQKPFMEGAG